MGNCGCISSLSFKLIILNLLPSAQSFKKGCCQLQAKVCAQNTVQACLGKKCDYDRPDMTIAVDWDIKQQTKPKSLSLKLAFAYNCRSLKMCMNFFLAHLS